MDASRSTSEVNEKLSKLEAQLNKLQYSLTYIKLKHDTSPILITGSADQTIKVWNIEKVCKRLLY